MGYSRMMAFPILQQVQDERKLDPVAGGVSILQQVQDERKLIRFMLMAAISRYRRPFPTYPAGRPFPLILNFVEGWAGKGIPKTYLSEIATGWLPFSAHPELR